MTEAKWYVAHTYSGYENKVKIDIEKTIENRGLQDQILKVCVPMQSVLELKDGVEKVSDKKMFPGYVLVHMHMNDETWYVVRNTPGVRLIVGAETKPIPLSDAEYQQMMDQIAQSQERSELNIPYQEGDVVLLKNGDFKGMKGNIKEVDADKGMVVVSIEMLGRLTPVAISVDQIELAN